MIKVKEKQNLKMQERKCSAEKKMEAFGEDTLGRKKQVDELPNIAEDAETQRKLRVPRSDVYMQLFDMVDLLSATDDEIIEKIKENLDEDSKEEFLSMSTEEIQEKIKLSFVEEFESLQIDVKSVLYGVLSKCFITGCDCHAITSEGYILNHFKVGGPIPLELAKGRPILMQYGPKCKCVEVYNNCCRVIMNDSSVITIDDVK
jgi:hypothetical protein